MSQTPNRLQDAARLYQTLDGFSDLSEVQQYVRNQNAYAMTPEQWADLVLIVTGMDSCATAAPLIREAARGMASSLVPPTAIPDPRTFGPPLCPNVNAFGSSADYRFQPRCETAESVAPPQPAGEIPAAFLGVWSGTIIQDRPPGVPPTAINVTIRQGVRGETVGNGSYAALGCQFHWDLVSASESQIVVNEVVDSGSDCTNNIEVTLIDQGDTLRYDFENGNGRGVLQH
jgi:hypothetical protein